MAITFNTQITTKLLDALQVELELAGVITVQFLNSGGVVLATTDIATPVIKSREVKALVLASPPTTLVLTDGEVSIAKFLASDLELFSAPVGSTTKNPLAPIIVSSTAFYAGGSLSLTSIRLEV